jgi:hypothetical protein
MIKPVFTPEMWITFMFKNKFFVGRTYLTEEKFEMVTGISDAGEVFNLSWSRISDVKQLKFVRNASLSEKLPDSELKPHEFNIRWN